MSDGLTIIEALVTIVGVLLLAYWCSKYLGKNLQRASNGRCLKVIDQIQVGQDKKIILVKLGERNYLIGVSQAGIQMLTEADGEFEDVEEQNERPFSRIKRR